MPIGDSGIDAPRGDLAPEEVVKGANNAYFLHVLETETGKAPTNGDPWERAKAEFPAHEGGIERLRTIADHADKVSELVHGAYRDMTRKLYFEDIEDPLAQRLLTDILISRANEHRSYRGVEEMRQAAEDLREELDSEGNGLTADGIIRTVVEGRFNDRELGPSEPF